ncbi:homeobox-leucine zipper protein HDG5-like [Apium graveolens]|uniref:homeobox-leucine zipper protein HDG5-like n=1 Tax=Apium graveolens TaxID=4045 RepID=UPI003D7A5FE5
MRSPFGLVIEECMNKLLSLNNVSLLFVRRSANMAAHFVAKMSYSFPGRLSTNNMSTNEIGSGSGNGNGNGNGNGRQRSFRHSDHQIREMEWFFQRCSHPDMEQRLQMARDLELAEPKVKYWFQNRRNQLKISALKAENEIWKKECLRLQEENQSFRAISSRIVVPLLRTVEPATSALLPGVQFTEELKHAVMNIASQCIVELRMMCESREPLWNRANDGKAILDIAQYNRMFPWGSSSNEHLRIEASLWSTYVLMNSGDLVDTFCDAEKWMQMFPSIVSKAKTLHIVQDSENFNGSLYLMYAELQTLSPVVHPREVHFMRYCQQNGEDGSWGIVDFPVDFLVDSTHASPFPKCWRKPSGCIIQNCLTSDRSSVTWLEHVEVQERPMHPIIDEFVNSGTAFGAIKWLSVLQRQSERLRSLRSLNASDYGVPSLEVKSDLMNVAKRMMRSFCISLSSLSGKSWMALPDNPEDQSMKISTRPSTEPGNPIGLICSAASTTTLPYSYVEVFNLLRDIRCTTQKVDGGLKENFLQELARISTGGSPANCISLFRIYHANSTQECVLHECCSDDSESVVAYTALSEDGIAKLGTADSASIQILTNGFVLVPIQQGSGCLLTVGIQSLASMNPYENLSLLGAMASQRHLDEIISRIKEVLSGRTANK